MLYASDAVALAFPEALSFTEVPTSEVYPPLAGSDLCGSEALWLCGSDL